MMRRRSSRSRTTGRSRTTSEMGSSLETWGLPDHLTTDQTEKLQDLKNRVSEADLQQIKFDVESQDSALCRYLRARKFDVDASFEMIENCRNRRLEDGVSECVQDGPSACLKCPAEVYKCFNPEWYVGFDKAHRLVSIQKPGLLNTAAIDCLTTTENILRYHWCNMEARNEQFRCAAEAYGEPNISMTIITDLQGMTTSTMTKKVYHFINVISKLGSDCYPELMGKTYIVNAPFFFVGVWRIIRSWIDQRTASKIEISSGCDSEKLLEVIDPDVLPVEYGGNAVGKIPKSSNALYSNLGRASSHTKQVELKAGEEFIVQFFTNFSGIQYTVSFKPAGKKKVNQVKTAVSDTSTDSGLFSMEEIYSIPGQYTIKWKNTSKLHPKGVVYHIFAPSEPEKIIFC
mmetsp:Transcript_12725/g.16724  ORF Transcript_12725/g.16724 Transcript_12725/m.16724 type:complete len:401 (+) Transcript_12725:139-1341(+)